MSFFYLYNMKNILKFALILSCGFANAQFTINITSPKDFSANEAYLYTLSGTKDILADKIVKTNGGWKFNIKNNYSGMLKVYFPEVNASISFISENRNVAIVDFTLKNNKVSKVTYGDEANKLFYDIQDQQKKKEQILPALYQIQSYYREDSSFWKALSAEVNSLNTDIAFDSSKFPFINYYFTTYNKYLIDTAGKLNPANDEISNFINTSQNYLETSSLLKPMLMTFLSNTDKANLGEQIDKLLKTVDVETPRGQTLLSELIDIFNIYGMKELKTKYLTEAKGLKCSINERLANTLKSSTNTEIGKLIPNNKFIKPYNTTVKSLHDVKADKKIIIFWSSTCPHCEKEIAEMVARYNDLKSRNIQVVGLSLDTDGKSYAEKTKLLPWINDTELKGWYSSYVDTYNVNATPTFYIVDSSNKIISNPDNFSEILDFLQMK